MFPESQQDCKDLATEFIGQSQAGFNNCVGCIDGMLLWMEKPSKQQCAEAGVDSGKFYCGRKGKYGLNLQLVCDACHHFIDVSLQHPASTSDYLSFVTSSLYQQFCEHPLPTGYCLYGDNAYVNDSNMAVPYPNQGHGPKDDFNFFHLQVWINI